MRAQIGQNVDPRLGILDFSPQADAARTRAAGQMALGSAIGEALTDYKANVHSLKKLLRVRTHICWSSLGLMTMT
jgi:hypothetical protein